ncbi:MAG: hypothetical protein Q7R47_05635, partial [Candidatus Diapherotrites archaeon]|nr:hypothetical protein [Candidatus Diapherotrites archaeon]
MPNQISRRRFLSQGARAFAGAAGILRTRKALAKRTVPAQRTATVEQEQTKRRTQKPEGKKIASGPKLQALGAAQTQKVFRNLIESYTQTMFETPFVTIGGMISDYAVHSPATRAKKRAAKEELFSEMPAINWYRIGYLPMLTEITFRLFPSAVADT